MAKMKTQPTEVTVEDFLDDVADERARADSFALVRLMEKVTGEKPKMWGPAIVGFGKYHYKYESGHEGEICITGFSPRKGNLALYILASAPGQAELLAKLGKHKAGKGCLYIKKLEDVNRTVLETLISQCVETIKKRYPDG